ncbi:MAG: low molecular weight phosphatase family protein [Archaeoglobaceae archaeon]|uniref:Low molecular weight phosphatase family protein n=1 Tax=Archaeoglobus fulgidus TaxID=2234 RepID=A0A7J3M0A7_ARCFL
MKVLFVCIRNTARSVIAEAIFNSVAKIWKAESAGIEKAERVDENVAEFLRRRGLKPKDKPRSIEEVNLEDYDLIVTVCEESSCVVLPTSKKMIHWHIEDVAGKDFATIEKAFNEIKKKVEELVRELERS